MGSAYSNGYHGITEAGDGGTYGRGDIVEASSLCCPNYVGKGLQTERKAEKEIEWPVIGIDLGTTNSCVAVWHEGRVEIIPNELGNRTTPSVVSFTDYDRLIGEAATNQASKNLVNTIFDAKRLIGRRFRDAIVQQDIKLWPFEVIDGTDLGKDQPMIVVEYMGQEKIFTPEEISAMTLAKMKGMAEAFLGTSVINAVITVPAHFNSSQRQATKDAGTIAGLNVIRLLNEPTAAAIPYSLDMEINKTGNAKKNVLVFHLGGGTFDVSLVHIEKGRIRVKSTRGDSHLGGTDFDNRMVCDFVEEFTKKHKKDISKNLRALARLRVASEKAKRVLSLFPQADVEIDCLFEGIDFSSSITRAHFEDLNKELFLKFTEAIDQSLDVACIERCDVHDVVLVGGSSRVPKVRKILEDYFVGKERCNSIHPEEAVASGAAMYAAILGGLFTKNKDIKLEDITHFSLCIRHDGNSMDHVPPTSNTAIPRKVTRYYDKIYFRYSYMLEAFENENSEYNFVSKLVISGVHGEWSEHSILVYFDIDENGILDVSAEIRPIWIWKKTSSRKWNNGRLLREDIQRMIKEAESYKYQDAERKRLLQCKSALESNAYTTLERLDDIGNINNEEKAKIKEDIAKTLESMEQKSDLSEITSLDQRLGELRKRVEDLHFQDKTMIIDDFLDSL